MAVIIGGHETGVQNSSLNLLARNDTTGSGAAGHAEAIYANVSNGNLVIAHQDAYLPSIGDDYQLVRTYNAWGQIDGDPSGQGRWRLSSTVQLYLRDDNGTAFYEVVYGDGSVYDFRYDSATGQYVCTDGAGAFKTLEDLGTGGDPEPSYILTRADQTRLSFDSAGRLIKLEDTNDISIDYIYNGDQLTQVIDDQGHVINYTYQDGRLQQVTDEQANVLVQYIYDANGRLDQVIDRAGHITQYDYTADGFLERIVLPDTQVVDDQTETYDTRELSFTYDTIDWAGDSQQSVKVLTRITDAQGGITTFDYDFAFEQGGSDTSGTTTVVDALGNNRAYSNETEYVDWRLENGYYQSYDAAQAAADPSYQAQVDAIKNAHSLAYTYRSDGYISQVIDQQGFRTLYSYDENDNLISVTDANGWGVTHSDSDYYRQMRAELGVTDASGEGKLVAELTTQQIADLTEAFTSHFEYDQRGNLTISIDNADNVTTYTYTDFNKLASSTSAVGNALAGGQMPAVNPDEAFRDVQETAIAALSDGGYVVAFTELDGMDGDGFGVFYQRFDAAGNRIGEKVLVNSHTSSDQNSPRIAVLDNGGFVVTWDSSLQDGSGPGIYGQCFDAAGNKVNGEFQANTTITFQFENRVAALEGGGFVVTWTSYSQDGDGYGIFGRRFDAYGNAVSSEFQINTYSQSWQFSPTVTGLADGGFVAAWNSLGNDGEGLGIFGQRYDAAGNAVGGEFQVNTYTANSQDSPAITSLSDGGFVISYQSGLQDGDGYGIFGQRFDATGNKVGSEFQINTYTDSDQISQQITSTPDGGFVVVWQSHDQDGDGKGIYGQIYDANGNPLGSEFLATETTNAHQQDPDVAVLNDGTMVIAYLSQYVDTDDVSKNQILQTIISADQVQNGQITDLNESCVTDPLATEIEYDPALLAAYTTYFEYDDNQNLIERRDPGGDITRFEYDDNGNLENKIVCLDAQDPHNPDKQQITHYGYDAFGNLNSITDAENNTSSSIYDHFGNLVQYTDANGGITSYTYDDDNRLLTVTDPENHTTINTYDAVGNRISITDAGGHTVTRVYDRNNRLIATIDPSESDPLQDRTTRYEYDVVGNRTAVIDAENHRTEYRFNTRRELVEILTEQTSDENGQPVRYQSTMAYDGAGNRIRTTDYNSNTTEVIYTQNNLIRQQTDPNGHITRYEYDANNNTVQIIAGVQLPEAKRQILQFSYDEENQLIASTDAIGNALAQSNDPVYQQMRSELGYAMLVEDLSVDDQQALRARHTQYTTYDAVGNRVSVTDANGNITEYAYDGNNRLVLETLPEVTDPQSGQPVRYTVEHRYDANGNQIETIDQNSHSTTYTFDRDDRLVMVQDANGIKTVFEYDSRHNRTAVMIGVDASADAQGHIDITGVDQARIIRYTYNEFNQVTAVTDAMGNALAQSNEALYQQKRSELGYAALAEDLSAADQQALRALYTRHMTYDKVGNQLSSTDHLGRTSQYTYDELNRLTSTTDALEHTTTMAYDGNGNLVRQTDALTRTSTFEYDSMNRLTHSTDALDVVTQRQYDDFGNLILQTRALGSIDERTSTYEYDLNNRLIRQTDPGLHSQSYEYDAVGNRIRTTDGRGNSTGYIYDALNRTIRIIDPLSFETRYQYDGVGNRIGIIDANSGAIQMDYDPGNRLVSITDAQQRVTTYAYDVRGNRIEQRTAAGTVEEQLTTYEYDAQNNLRRVIDADNGITDTDYDRVYNRIETTDANGNSTTYEFDAVNRLIRITDALGQLTQYSYDAVGNRLSQTDALGRITTFAYDDNNQLIRQIAPDDIETHYSYDDVGNRTQITRAANTADAVTDTFVYDLDDQLISQTDALGNTTTYAYDENHNRTTVTDARGNSTVYTYDANNRVSHIQDAENNIVQYKYDGNGNRTQVIDARSYVTTTYYNANNEVTLSVDAEGYATGYTYDDNGNVISQTLYMTALSLPLDPAVKPEPTISADDRTIEFEYDQLNRVTTRIDAQGVRTEYIYDAVGNRRATIGPNADPATSSDETYYRNIRKEAGIVDGNGNGKLAADLSAAEIQQLKDLFTTRSYYDDIGRQIAGVSAQGYLTTYRYDSVGNLISQTLYNEPVSIPAQGVPEPAPGDSGRTTSMIYDAANRLVRHTSAAGVHTDYEYDHRGNRTAVIEAAGSIDQRQTDYVYDNADRLTDTIDALDNVTHLTLDANGNVIEQYEAYGTDDQRLTGFFYDGNNRVQYETRAQGTDIQMTIAYVYDGAGNLTDKTLAPGLAEQRTEHMEYDGNNRLTAQVNAEGERTESVYDGAGNRIQLIMAPGLAEQRTNTFEFDRDNRLIAGTDGENVRTEYRYDAAGNKIETIQAVGLTEERQSLYRYDADNRLVSITDPMGAVTEYTYDALGNQSRIINANGVVQTNTFDAMGRVLTSEIGGILTANSYDLRGNLVTTTQSYADGTDARTTTYGYDQLDRQTRITDPEGFSTTIEYDAFGNQTLITHGVYLLSDGDDGYDAAKVSQQFVQTNQFGYDAAGRMTGMTDGEGNVVTYSYDAVGNRTGMTDGNGYAMVTSDAAYYLNWRQALGYVDALGAAKPAGDLTETEIAQLKETFTTHYTYDLANRLIRTDTPEGGISINTYDEVGNRIEERLLQSDDGANPVWITRTYEYDGNARQTASIDPYNVRTEYDYDAMGNCTAVTAAAGTGDARTTHTEYDLNNRVSADIDALGNRTEYAYDAMGNRIKATDALGRQAHYYFDGSNNLVCILDPEGCLSVFTYDSAGNRTGETIHMNVYTGDVDDYAMPTPTSSDQDRVSISQYDGNGRVIRREQADHSVTTYSYDAAGNLKTETQYGTARTLEYDYDLNNRLIQFTDVDDTVTSFTYDGSNNKTSETITHTYTNDPNTVRRTTYQYDLNNRQVSQVYDPDGMNLVQATAYDKLGNVTAQTDANGNTTGYQYDLNNRLVRGIDALGNDTQYGYDNVGNRISVTDARGYTTDYVYDDNNRLVQEISPAVNIYTIENEFETIRPTITHQYDDVGNEEQTIDASGYITTRYFDANGRLTAEINWDNALREWTYNAAGEVKTETLYMTRLTDAAHNPDELTRPSGDVRLTTTEYDLGGRVKRIIHPQIDVTSLQGADTDNPTYTVTSMQPEALFVYDAYGNQVESFDPNGNRTVSYYDLKGRLVAQVDAMGYLTEFEYDAQDNMIEQWVYVAPLADPATVDPSARPAPPAGDVYWTSRTYDAAGRLIEEKSPEVEVYDNTGVEPTTERVITRYTYDGVGNQTSRTLAADSNDQVTEYYYFDALNRCKAAVDANRVASWYEYDPSGNQTMAHRYYTALNGSLDLAAMDATAVYNELTENNNDQEITRIFDELGRQERQSDKMYDASSGVTYYLQKEYAYDANGNLTRSVDEDGYIQRSQYDANGNKKLQINYDDSTVNFVYDVAGNQRIVDNDAVWKHPIRNIRATADYGLQLVCDVDAFTATQTYVIYDFESHEDIDDYEYQSQVHEIDPGISTETFDFLNDVYNGEFVYCRVVAVDSDGNITYTDEKKITVPPRLVDVSFTEDGSYIRVEVEFEHYLSSDRPKFSYLVNGVYTTPTSMQKPFPSNNIYWALVSTSRVSDPQDLAYRITWECDGWTTLSVENPQTPYETHIQSVDADLVEVTFKHSDPNISDVWFEHCNGGEAMYKYQLEDQGNGTFKLIKDLNALYLFDWRITWEDSEGRECASDMIPYYTLSYYGYYNESLNFWTGVERIIPELVIVDGKTIESALYYNLFCIDPELDAGQSANYSVYYGAEAEQEHTTTITPTFISDEHGLDIEVLFSDEEMARINGPVYVAWRDSQYLGDFTGVAELSLDEFYAYSKNLTQGDFGYSAQSIDLKIYYNDNDGAEVLVDWLQVEAPSNTTQSDETISVKKSLILETKEAGGQIHRDETGLYSVDQGLFSFTVKDSNLGSYIKNTAEQIPEDTGLTGNNLAKVSGGFATETEYNAMNAVIGAHDEQGRWIEYGVDANGNALVSVNQGLYEMLYENSEEDITTFADYDARNRLIAQFDAAVPVYGSEGLQRAVTRYEYDVNNNVTREIGPQSTTARTWNAMGRLEQETRGEGTALEFTTSYQYDRLGRNTGEIQGGQDPNALNIYKYYNDAGNLVREVSEGTDYYTESQYGYDSFGRRTSATDGLGNYTSMTYDNRDRLIAQTSREGNALATSNSQYYQDQRVALGYAALAENLSAADRQALWDMNTTRYDYDGRNNQTAVTDANGHTSNTFYDGLSRVEERGYYSEVYNTYVTTEEYAYDLYGNLMTETNPYSEGYEDTKKYYKEFGRLDYVIDSAGRYINYAHDDQGNVNAEYCYPSGPPYSVKYIVRNYDDNGRLSYIQDFSSDVETVYTYDLAGNRKTEVITTADNAHDRNILYDYDDLGQMIGWRDSVTGMHMHYEYDSFGNLRKAYTDPGFDPQNESGGDPDFQFVDREYSYDAGNRITHIYQRGALESRFEYDAAGNRTLAYNNGVTVTYQYDANGQVFEARDPSQKIASWEYDAVGNVEWYRTYATGGDPQNPQLESAVYKEYDEHNRLTLNHSILDNVQTIYNRDFDGSLKTTKVLMDGNTYTYQHKYFNSEKEQRIECEVRNSDGVIIARGDTVNDYNGNDDLIYSNKFKADSGDRDEQLHFVYNNDGQVLFRWHDTGDGDEIWSTEYFYANGNPVGEISSGPNGVVEAELETGTYSLVKQIGAENPGSSVTSYIVRKGDTLQSVAAAVYGNPSLWFVIADANGLDAGTPLVEGRTLQIPNTVKSGRLTAATHVIYDQTEIIGSSLPNLKSLPIPAPASNSGGGCGSFLAVVIIAVIAVVASIVTAGAAAVVASAVFGTALGSATVGVTLASFAIAGAVVGAAASMVQQGLFMAMGYQDEFNWGAVGAMAVAGALTGAAQGIGKVAEVGKISADSIKYAKTAASALKVASASTRQLMENGQITSWTSLAGAAVGGYTNTSPASNIDSISTSVEYVTPWVQLAETYVSNDYALTPTDWANAVGSTLSTAFTNPNATRLENTGNRIAANMVAAGGLSLFDRDAVEGYLTNSIGNEVGQYIGQETGQWANQKLESLADSLNQKRAARSMTLPTAGPARAQGSVHSPQLTAPTTEDNQGANAQSTTQSNAAGQSSSLYTVQSGETLSQIVANKYGTGFDEELILKIAMLNGISDPNTIMAGDSLNLPPKDSETLASIEIDNTLREALYQTNGPELGPVDITTVKSFDQLDPNDPRIPEITIVGQEEIPGLPPGATILGTSPETDSGYFQLNRAGKYSYDDNIAQNALKIASNAYVNWGNQSIDFINSILYDFQYADEYGGIEYLKARGATEWNWIKGAGKAINDIVQYSPQKVMNFITDPDLDAVAAYLKQSFSAEAWEGATTLAMSMIFSKNPGKNIDNVVDDVVGKVPNAPKSTVYRVQGGTPPKASWRHIEIDADGNPLINKTTLNVSIGDAKHAEYFQSLRPGSEVVSFDIPKWMDDFIQSEAIPQFKYGSNVRNQGGLAPKIVDPRTPGRSYELPSIWAEWLEEVAIKGSGKIKR